MAGWLVYMRGRASGAHVQHTATGPEEVWNPAPDMLIMESPRSQSWKKKKSLS